MMYAYFDGTKWVEGLTATQIKGLAKSGHITEETIIRNPDGKQAPAKRFVGLEFISQNNEATQILSDAKEKANQIIEAAYKRSEIIIANANEEANQILSKARSISNNQVIDHQQKSRFNHYDELVQLRLRHEEMAKCGITALDRCVKLGQTYLNDTLKSIASKMTINNFNASRDRMLKAITLVKSLNVEPFFTFNIEPENIEEVFVEKLREDFKRLLRNEEMKQEQQRIKEQIREEQKALREIERLKKKESDALKEREAAEKSRDEIQKAIADAIARANGEHTTAILEMEKALAEKEKEIAAKQQEIDDNQRAISNAQITKSGHIYVLSNIGSFGEGVYKIGMTRRSDPQERVDELGDASVPFPFDIHLMVGCDNAPELENQLHRHFNNARVNRVNLRKEYFRVSIDEVRHEIINFLGKDVDYIADPHVMEEFAEQYRQSLDTSLFDIEEVERLYEEVGIDIEVE